MDYLKRLNGAFAQNALDGLLDVEKAERLLEFSRALVDTNKSFNLTAITDENEIILKHFVDCASIAPLIPIGASLIDVGCGAGFPSVPVAILRPDVTIVALDSTAKRIGFINSIVKELGLTNICGVCGRAEEYVANNREEFDVCVSRAVARMNVLAELCIPYVKLGGLFIAMKSVKGDEEYSEASEGIARLGCSFKGSCHDRFEFLDLSTERKLFVFEKNRATPREFPRKYSQIAKKPL